MLGERKIGLVEGTDGSDVFPVIVEHIALEFVTPVQSLRDQLLAEILVTRMLVQEVKQRFAAEHIDPHGSQIGALLGGISSQPETACVHGHLQQ